MALLSGQIGPTLADSLRSAPRHAGDARALDGAHQSGLNSGCGGCEPEEVAVSSHVAPAIEMLEADTDGGVCARHLGPLIAGRDGPGRFKATDFRHRPQASGRGVRNQRPAKFRASWVWDRQSNKRMKLTKRGQALGSEWDKCSRAWQLMRGR